MADREVAHVFVDDLDALGLSDEDQQHLASVLRLRPGEAVVACDGAGAWRRCVVAASGAVAGPGGRRRERPSAFALVPAGDIEREARPRPEITVAFALVKGDRPEWAVQKLTELGVDQIVPLLTERSVVRPTGPGGTDRLRRVARAAAMQSRRHFLPEVADVTLLADFLTAHGGGCAFATLDGAPPSLDRPAVVIGPEGGWAEGEVPDGWPCVRLGPQVLRTETAAVTAGALLVALRDGLLDAASR